MADDQCDTGFVAGQGHPEPEPQSTRLADHTTLRVGGPATHFLAATTAEALVDAVADCDDRGEPVLVLGGGSNVLVADEGFDGSVVHIATKGYQATVSDCAGASVVVEAGENWDEFVAHTLAEGWVGLETLSGIPGQVGATPIQNVGAYGTEVASLIERVRTWDRQERAWRTFTAADCGFGYRTSRFKEEPGRWLVVQVSFQLELGDLARPLAYPELAHHLGLEVGERAPTAAVRDAVLEIRARKGMVLSEDDHDTWSAGSFFTNPVLTESQAADLPAEAPRYPVDGGVKTSAAWLIQAAGFDKGHGSDVAQLSGKHPLAITNRGGAGAADLVALAREVRDGVRDAFGVVLVPEVNLVGVSL